MILSRTPFRISFFGGGTDYPAWYSRHGGQVLACTINKYCYISCRYLPPFFDNRIRVVWSKIENCQSVDEIQHPAVREALRYLGIDRGVEIHHVGDLPARGGIGSSSAFTVGLLKALHALRGRMINQHDLAQEGIYIEQERLKETVGSQDQVMAAYGGVNHVQFHRNGQIAVRPLTLAPDLLSTLNDHLMLFYTGIRRTASDVAQTYVRTLVDKEDQLNLISDTVDHALGILDRGDLPAFGRLLHEAWRAKRSLSGSISNPQVEECYEAALSAGALGGKLIGAGGGGYMLIFAHPKDQPAIQQRLGKLIHVPIRFEYQGSHIIFYDPEEDYSAEEKIRATQIITPFQELETT